MRQENTTLKIKDLALLKSNPKQYYKTNKKNINETQKDGKYPKHLHRQVTTGLNEELEHIDKIYEEHEKLNDYMLKLVKESGAKPNEQMIDLNNVADAQQQVEWVHNDIWKKEVLFKESLREMEKLLQWKDLNLQEKSKFANTIQRLYNLLTDKNSLHSGQRDYIAEKYNYPNLKEYNESWEQLEKPVRKITNNLIKINNKYNLGLKME